MIVYNEMLSKMLEDAKNCNDRLKQVKGAATFETLSRNKDNGIKGGRPSKYHIDKVDLGEIETWHQIRKRHTEELKEALLKLKDAKYTQTEAAKALEIKPKALGNYIRTNGIKWDIYS